MSFTFAIRSWDGAARAGEILTAHGAVATPAFMPVATQAAVKGLNPSQVVASGARMVIMNTYHLWLRPGAELVAEQGGLHEFARWPHPIATDSGGFQAYSLAERVRLSEEGFAFASHLDGSRRLLTPEESMRVQGLLGSDIALQLDVCPPGGASKEQWRAAVERTTRWAERCLDAKRPDQALFGIVQGGTDIDLRVGHCETLAKLPLDGLALGGFSVGEPKPDMYRALEAVAPGMPRQRPRYLMGVGTPEDLLHGIGCGIDLFDCVMPTRNARNGQAFTSDGKVIIKQARYRDDSAVLCEDCDCSTCRGGYSRALLRHLFMAREMLAFQLLSAHNLHYYGALMEGAREAIAGGRYRDWAAEVARRWARALMPA